MVNSKNSFWQAFVISIVIFVAGLVLGFYIELSNISKSDLLIRNYEISLMDQQIKLASLSDDINFNCESAKRNLFGFADQVYLDASEFEEKDAQSKLTTIERTVLHQKYDLLRMNIWLESLRLRRRCNESFHTVLYFFDYGTTDVETRSEQRVLSLVLMDLKYNNPEEILLLPIAANLNLGSIDMIKEEYNISKSPSLIIDEHIVVDSLITLEELEMRIFSKESTKVIVLKP